MAKEIFREVLQKALELTDTNEDTKRFKMHFDFALRNLDDEKLDINGHMPFGVISYPNQIKPSLITPTMLFIIIVVVVLLFIGAVLLRRKKLLNKN